MLGSLEFIALRFVGFRVFGRFRVLGFGFLGYPALNPKPQILLMGESCFDHLILMLNMPHPGKLSLNHYIRGPRTQMTRF